MKKLSKSSFVFFCHTAYTVFIHAFHCTIFIYLCTLCASYELIVLYLSIYVVCMLCMSALYLLMYFVYCACTHVDGSGFVESKSNYAMGTKSYASIYIYLFKTSVQLCLYCPAWNLACGKKQTVFSDSFCTRSVRWFLIFF